MLLHKELTDRILNAFYEVYNELGYGFWKGSIKMHFSRIVFSNHREDLKK